MDKLYSSIFDLFLKETTSYITSLNWSYIMSVLIAYAVINAMFPPLAKNKINIIVRYRIQLIGLVLAMIMVWFNGCYTKACFQPYFSSFIFAMAILYGVVEKPIAWLFEKMPMLQNLQKSMQVTPDKKDNNAS